MLPDYADPSTERQITSWAQSRYGSAAPSLTGYYAPNQPATATAQPTMTSVQPTTSVSTWDQARASNPAPAAPGITPPPATRPAPAPLPAPTRQSVAPTTMAPVKTEQLDQSQLAMRTVDAGTETVQGRMSGLMDENSQYMQQARADAMRTANERGMLNSAMAASGGTDAAIRSALPIATTDAATYAGAADYNVALKNQATMWNADQKNQNNRLDAQYTDSAAGRAQAKELAQMQDDTTRWQEAQRLANSQWETALQADTTRWTETQRLQQAQWERQVADATTRWQQEMQNAQSRYNTDEQYRRQSDETRLSMANNIIQNMDLSPDRKAAMLEALGQGTSAGYNPDGSYRPGSGLAGAVYVLSSVSADLSYGRGPYEGPAELVPGATGPMGNAMNSAYRQVQEQQAAQREADDRESWGRGVMTRSSDDYYYNSI